MTRRFNALTLMSRTTRLSGGKHLTAAGRTLALTRGLSKRIVTFRKPPTRTRPYGRKKSAMFHREAVRLAEKLHDSANAHLFTVEAALEAFKDVPIDRSGVQGPTAQR